MTDQPTRRYSKQYSFEAFDRWYCLKPGISLWLIMAFLMRPYVIYVLSVVNRRDRMGLVNMIYPDRDMMALGALAALPVILLFIVWIKRKPGAPDWVRKVWHRGLSLLLVSAVLNIVALLLPLLGDSRVAIDMPLLVQLFICGFIVWELLTSTRLREAFADFPEPEES